MCRCLWWRGAEREIYGTKDRTELPECGVLGQGCHDRLAADNELMDPGRGRGVISEHTSSGNGVSLRPQ